MRTSIAEPGVSDHAAACNSALDPLIIHRARVVTARRAARLDEYGQHIAKAAGLHYVTNAGTDIGLSRTRRRGRFIYLHADGRQVTSRMEISRINSLAIPPAYSDVWICPASDGHIQAIGRDAKGRKQYRYHPRWRAIRDAAKYERMLEFGLALPAIRRATARFLRLEGTPRDKILAAVLRLLEITLIRVGSDEYARQNRSYGLTTLRTRHVEVCGTKVSFGFRGKSGVEHKLTFQHPGLAKIVKLCMQIPGRELFQYLDEDGRRHTVTAADVNSFLQKISGADFTAKDYRTWAGSVLALAELLKSRAASEREAKKHMLATIQSVAEQLGNTPAICRKAYIHPALLDSYACGKLEPANPRRIARLRAEEVAFLDFLRRFRRDTAFPAGKEAKPKSRQRCPAHDTAAS